MFAAYMFRWRIVRKSKGRNLAFFLNFIPNIGLFYRGGSPCVAGVYSLWAGYVVLNLGVGNNLEPRFMGRG